MRRLKARLPLGPVVVDPAGTVLNDDDRRRMLHPAAGGVILFARNFENTVQLQDPLIARATTAHRRGP
jgi:beta-N-acetylhexosaminidase